MKKLCALLVLCSAPPAYADIICNHYVGRTECQNTQTGEAWQRRDTATQTIFEQTAPPAHVPKMKYLDKYLPPELRSDNDD